MAVSPDGRYSVYRCLWAGKKLLEKLVFPSQLCGRRWGQLSVVQEKHVLGPHTHGQVYFAETLSCLGARRPSSTRRPRNTKDPQMVANGEQCQRPSELYLMFHNSRPELTHVCPSRRTVERSDIVSVTNSGELDLDVG